MFLCIIHRYHHAAVCIANLHLMLMFGGVLEDLSTTNELWTFSLDSGRWSLYKVMIKSLLTTTIIIIIIIVTIIFNVVFCLWFLTSRPWQQPKFGTRICCYY